MKKITILMMTICLFASTAIFAVDGIWNVENDTDANTNWSLASNWASDTPADGAGAKAYFNNSFSADWVAQPRGVIVDTPRTIGEIYFGSSGANYSFWSLISGTVTLDNNGSKPIIDVDGIWGAMIDSIAGSDGFTKTGAEMLRFYGDNSISGTIVIAEGNFGVYGPNSIKNAEINILSAGFLDVGNGNNLVGKNITITNADIGTGLGKIKIEGLAGASATINNTLTIGRYNAVDSDVNATATVNGDITMLSDSGLGIGGDGGVLNLNGVVSGSSMFRLLGHSNNGAHSNTFFINSVNNYDGSTLLDCWGSSTRNELGGHQRLPAATTLILSINSYDLNGDCNIFFDLNDYTQRIGKLSVYPGLRTGEQAVIFGGASGKLTADKLYVDDDGGTFTLDSGELVILGNSEYTNKIYGPFVANSTVSLADSVTIINSTVSGTAGLTLNSGAVIGGIGNIGNITFPAGSTIAPGTNLIVATSIQTLNAGNLVMESGSAYNWEVDTVGSDIVDADSLDVSSATSGSITINVVSIGAVDAADTNILFNTGVSTAGMAAKFVVAGPGTAAAVVVENGNDLLLTGVVPEPAIFGLFALLGLAFFRRK